MKSLFCLRSMRRSCGLFLVVCAFALLAVACGDDGNKGGSCGADQQYVQRVGDKVINDCLDLCEDDACATGFRCTSGVCVEGSSANGGNAGNGGNTGNGGNSGNSETVTPEQEQLCEDVCNLLWGQCFRDTCTVEGELDATVSNLYDECVNGSGEEGQPTCAQELAADPQLEMTYQQFAANTSCEDRKASFCGQYALLDECSCAAPTNVGEACAADTDCEPGDLRGVCATDAPGGYCLAAPCPTEGAEAGDTFQFAGCGAGNVCRVSADPDSGQLFGACLDGCSAKSDCRDGYVCVVTGLAQDMEMNLSAIRVCLPPECEMDNQCGDGQRCNEGVCEIPCGTMDLGNGQTLTDVCVAIGGTCVDGADMTSYCVLP